MHEDDRLLCVLCQRSEHNKITGVLSTKEDVTAHQNCLLFSSALFCRNTPQFDNLFGFSVDDVLKEVKRGRQLFCNKCKKRGATVGCEVGRCKKSYHYPCAVEERAKIVEDVTKEKYVLYCYNHYPKTEEKNPSENGSLSLGSKSRANGHPEEPGTSKVYCLTCEKSEGNISLENWSYSVVMSYCDKHAPGSHKKNASGDSTDQRPTSRRKRSSIKRRLSFRDKQNGTPSKRRSKVSWAPLRDDSSNLGDKEPDSITAPLESLDTDIDDSKQLVCDPLTSYCIIRETHFCLEEESGDGSTDEDEKEAEPESLLPPFSQPLPASQADFSIQTSPVSPVFPPSEVQCKTERQTKTDDGDYDLALTVMRASGKLLELVGNQQEELQGKQRELQEAAAAMEEAVSALRRDEEQLL